MIAPGETHVTIQMPLANFQVLKVDPVVVEHELGDEGQTMRRRFSGGQTDQPGVAAHFTALCEAIEDSTAGALERRALLRRFLFAALSTQDGEPDRVIRAGCERAVSRACEVLRSRYQENVNLGFLERETGVSKYHLERSFRAKVGLPIHRYLKLVRLEKAQALLRSGQPATMVAQDTGFFDSAHMGRTFTSELGITPRAYACALDRRPQVRQVGSAATTAPAL